MFLYDAVSTYVGQWESLGSCSQLCNNTCKGYFNTSRARQNGCQTTFSNALSWMKMYEFWLRFHCSLFLGVQWTIFQLWFRQWLSADQATSHYLDQWWLVYWHIYVSLGLNELNDPSEKQCHSEDINVFQVGGIVPSRSRISLFHRSRTLEGHLSTYLL